MAPIIHTATSPITGNTIQWIGGEWEYECALLDDAEAQEARDAR